MLFSLKVCLKKKEKKEKAQIIVGEKFPLPHTPDVFPAECVCVCGCHFYAFDTWKHTHTHTHSRRRKNWGLVRKNTLELTHAPRFLVQRYLISCWLVLGWLDHSSIFGWLGWYYTFWSTGRGTDMISLIFFIVWKSTQGFLSKSQKPVNLQCQVLILKFSNKLKPLAQKTATPPKMKIDRFWLCGPRAKQRKSLFGGDLSPRQCEARVSEPTPISSLGEQMFATSVRNYLATANMAHGLLADWLAVLDNGTGKIFKFSSSLLLPLTLLEGTVWSLSKKYEMFELSRRFQS